MLQSSGASPVSSIVLLHACDDDYVLLHAFVCIHNLLPQQSAKKCPWSEQYDEASRFSVQYRPPHTACHQVRIGRPGGQKSPAAIFNIHHISMGGVMATGSDETTHVCTKYGPGGRDVTHDDGDGGRPSLSSPRSLPPAGLAHSSSCMRTITRRGTGHRQQVRPATTITEAFKRHNMHRGCDHRRTTTMWPPPAGLGTRPSHVLAARTPRNAIKGHRDHHY